VYRSYHSSLICNHQSWPTEQQVPKIPPQNKHFESFKSLRDHRVLNSSFHDEIVDRQQHTNTITHVESDLSMEMCRVSFQNSDFYRQFSFHQGKTLPRLPQSLLRGFLDKYATTEPLHLSVYLLLSNINRSNSSGGQSSIL
jgi:hypothetical protein